MVLKPNGARALIQLNGLIDSKAIVGDNIQVNPDGSMYKLVRYEQLGFWVSFNRTAGDLGITTVTIQKIR